MLKETVRTTMTGKGRHRQWGDLLAPANEPALVCRERIIAQPYHYTARLDYGDSKSGLGRIAYNPVDDRLYGVLAGSEVFRLDPRTHDKHVVHDGAAAHLDVHPNGDVYFSSGAELFRYDLPGGRGPA